MFSSRVLKDISDIRDVPPTIDSYEALQYLHDSLIPATDEIAIIVDFKFFDFEDVKIKIFNGVIEIRAEHPRKQNPDGKWETRDCVYTYELPPEVAQEDLKAEWYDDKYLRIWAMTSNSNKGENCESGGDSEIATMLIPKLMRRRLRSDDQTNFIKETLEDVSNKTKYVLHHIGILG